MTAHGRRTALVTGASVGIGRATALALAARGYDIAGGSRSAKRLEDVAAEVEGLNAAFLPVVGNVREPATASAAVETVLARFGRLDILVNNAGGAFPSAAEELSEGGWRAILGTTLDGPWWFSQAAYPLLRRTSGVIVNIASIAGFRPSPRMASYAVAKAGVVAMTRALGTEWAPDVRVVAVAPGTVATEGIAELLSAEEERDRAIGRIPAGRMGEPEEVAALVCFLASEQAAWLTATTIIIDGGQSSEARAGA